jgi:hypothetical protein
VTRTLFGSNSVSRLIYFFSLAPILARAAQCALAAQLTDSPQTAQNGSLLNRPCHPLARPKHCPLFSPLFSPKTLSPILYPPILYPIL